MYYAYNDASSFKKCSFTTSIAKTIWRKFYISMLFNCISKWRLLCLCIHQAYAKGDWMCVGCWNVVWKLLQNVTILGAATASSWCADPRMCGIRNLHIFLPLHSYRVPLTLAGASWHVSHVNFQRFSHRNAWRTCMRPSHTDHACHHSRVDSALSFITGCQIFQMVRAALRQCGGKGTACTKGVVSWRGEMEDLPRICSGFQTNFLKLLKWKNVGGQKSWWKEGYT